MVQFSHCGTVLLTVFLDLFMQGRLYAAYLVAIAVADLQIGLHFFPRITTAKEGFRPTRLST